MPDAPNAASAALFAGSSVLLIKRAFAPWAGHWSLPGGRLEPGETAEDCVTREVMEELALRVAALRPVIVQDMGKFRLAVFAAGVPATIAPQPNAEIAAWRWHDLDDPLPTPYTDQLDVVLAAARAALA